MAPRSFASEYDPRHNAFDAIRFALASLVVWSHSFPLSGRPNDWVSVVSRGQASGGSLAVDGFFVLSGFLVAQSWLARPALATFARNRFLRIVPALAAAVVFDAFLLGPLVSSLPPAAYFETPGTWLHLLAVVRTRYLSCPGVFAANPIPELMNGSLWTLRWEIGAYALLALIGLAGGKRWLPLLVTLLVVSWGADVAASGLDGPGPHVLACFAAGALAYTLRARIPYAPRYAIAAVALLGVTLAAGRFRFVVPLAGGYLLLFAAFAGRTLLDRFARYGDFSYGTYVFAYPVQQTIVHLHGGAIGAGALFAFSFPATLLLALLSWHLVEAPALARKRDGRQRSAGTTSAAIVRNDAAATSRGMFDEPGISQTNPSPSPASRVSRSRA